MGTTDITVCAGMHLIVMLLPTEIQKVLTKLSKGKDCEIIGRWRKVCVRHFYWAATSTNESLGKVKLAKFQAFLSHVINQHKDLHNRLFNACAHGDNIKPKVWMLKVNLHLQHIHSKLYTMATCGHYYIQSAATLCFGKPTKF